MVDIRKGSNSDPQDNKDTPAATDTSGTSSAGGVHSQEKPAAEVTKGQKQSLKEIGELQKVADKIAQDSKQDLNLFSGFVQAGRPNPAVAARQARLMAELADQIQDVDTIGQPTVARLSVHEQEDGAHYRWVRNDPGRINALKGLGYEVVQGGEEKGGDPGAGTTPNTGDLVLMKSSEERFQLRELRRTQQINAALDAPRQMFMTQADRAGIEAEDTSRTRRAPLAANS